MDMRVNTGAPDAVSRGRAFDAARLHSRRVRRLRVAVPLVALLGVAGFVGYAFFNPFAARNIEVSVGNTQITGNRIVMELPHLTGFNKKQQAYNVTAESASQHITAPGLIDLTKLEAVISMEDKSRSTLSALTGKFDSAKEILTLDDDVQVKSSKGYAADLKSAVIDFKAGTVLSDKPVSVALANGTIQGGALSISSGGAIISFTGGVRSRFQRPVNGGEAQAGDGATQ